MHAYVVILFFSAGIALTLAAQAWHWRPARGAMALCLLLAAVGLSSLAYGLNLSATALHQKLFWNNVEYLGAAFIIPLILVTALALTGHDRWLRPAPLAALFSIPTMTLFLNWTNAWHHLYYTRTWLEPSSSLSILAKERGPFYLLFFLYTYLVIFLAIFLVAKPLRSAQGRQRTQLFLLLLAFCAPLVMNAPYLFRLMPHQHINLTLLGFFCSALLLSVAMFRYRLIASIPLDMEERNALLLRHAHALLYTINPDGIMTYVSPNWPLVLGHAPDEVIGRNFSVLVLPEDHAACFEFLDRVVKTGAPQTGAEYRVIHKNGDVFWHTSSIIPVKDKKGKLLAYVGAAHDITRLKRTQQELSDANERLSSLIASREEELRQAIAETLTAAESEARRIGQDIHDGLCQELIGLSRMTETLTKGITAPGNALAPQLEKIGQQAVDLARLARAYSHELTLHDLDVDNLPDALAALASRMEHLFQVTVEVSISSDLGFLTRDQSVHLYRIMREGAANAIHHAKATTVWMDIVQQDRQLVLSVSSNGTPLPAGQEIVPGLGLRQIAMRARLIGAHFELARPEGQCAVLTLSLPLAES